MLSELPLSVINLDIFLSDLIDTDERSFNSQTLHFLLPKHYVDRFFSKSASITCLVRSYLNSYRLRAWRIDV